jgi:alkaline phosphatase D
VRWEVATDARFTKVVRRGTAVTGPFRDHTVKVDVTGLRTATWYFYRFTALGGRSRVGRTRTAPAERATPARLRLGVASCANWQAGYFAAYRGLARRNDLDAILHLGDYFYEYGAGGYGEGPENTDVRRHDPPHEVVSLSDYRRRHAQYKTDEDLQDLHARYPFIVTWDDHEVTNDQWSRGAENHNPGEGDYLRRRARAHRAYDEWMPARMSGTAALNDGARLYRRIGWGQLAEISMLDLRSYRSKQVDTAAPTPVPTTEQQISDPERTLLGAAQMRWLKNSLSRYRPLWRVVGNPVMIAPVTFAQVPRELLNPINDVTGLLPDDGFPYNVDQWDGYTADRREILDQIADHQVENALFVTGDIHSGWACELPYDAATYPVSESAGVEFVCSSVTSNNLDDITGSPPRTSSLAVEEIIKANNRHVKYLNFDDHGFSVLDITPKRAQMDWFVIADRSDRRTAISHTASYATRVGTNKVEAVDGPVR